MFMTYNTRKDVNVTESDSYEGQQIFIQDNITPAQHERIQYWAQQVPPPSAPSLKEIRANCQTWCIDVMEGLLKEGIGTPEAIAEAQRRRTLLPFEQQQTQPIIPTDQAGDTNTRE